MNPSSNEVKLYSYVVDHDTGFAPNPFGRICTLVCCKFSVTGKRKNIVELAGEGDWIVGLGGKSKRSAGHGTIIYAMRVTKKLSLAEYCKSSRFRLRKDADAKAARNQSWRRALISNDFYYFGRKKEKLKSSLFHKLDVRRRFRSRFSQEFIRDFITWMKKHYKHKRGRNGLPCVWEKENDRNERTRNKC
jgi:Nucleotide modification associated domain 2